MEGRLILTAAKQRLDCSCAWQANCEPEVGRVHDHGCLACCRPRGVEYQMQHELHKWAADIDVNGNRVTLGCWATEDQAARAYDFVAISAGVRCLLLFLHLCHCEAWPRRLPNQSSPDPSGPPFLVMFMDIYCRTCDDVDELLAKMFAKLLTTRNAD